MRKEYRPDTFERKWQERWFDSGIWEGNAGPEKPKFFLMFAYPGVSGYLHVGHMRGYTYSDVITRYKRMAGFNVLFPVGAHATGNVAITFARKIERGSREHIEFLKANGCPDAEIERLKDPEYVVKFFSNIYINEYWKKFGFLADWKRFMTTIDPGYMKFIQWQFRKLHERGMLIQKPYYGTACMECGPVAVDASETDISKGGNAEKLEWTLLKFRMGDEFLVAATLRPETVFGQTNFWANPDVTYVRARVNGETWILSPQGAEKLSFQKDSVEIIGEVGGKELIGRTVLAPIIERQIPVLPSEFTDPDYGTGLVTSVPSDAPYDWIALRDLAGDPESCAKFGIDQEMVRAIEPIPIIESRGYGLNPAAEICRKMGIESQNDPKLEEATKEIYKAGFHTGRMRENCGQFAGKPVMVAKEEVKSMMLEMGVADVMYDLSEPVVCRCGGKVIVKQIPDQWFIDYGHPEVTGIAKAHVAQMNILPQEYKDNLPGILDWFKERACARLGNWLGTPFPYDERWTVEPISDSTLYSAYYMVSNHVNNGGIDPEKLDDAFFDCIFLGRGSPEEASKDSGIDPGLIAGIRKDFEYWYPLDINLGGKEHQTVHFPVFLMNHAAILPEMLPRGIFVNYWIIGKSGKMSKSKGGAEPIPDAASTYTVDGLRLYYCHIASPHVDVEWDPADVNNSRKSAERAWHFASELLDMRGGTPGPMDAWLESRMHNHVLNARNMMDGIRLRDAANIVYFDMANDLRWYLRRGGDNADLIKRAADAWIGMMAPFTPHMAEELWEAAGHERMVSASEYPDPEAFARNAGAELAEDFMVSVQADISGILKMTGMSPKKICLYTAPKWKFQVQDMMANEKKDMGAVMKWAVADPEMKSRSKEISAFASKLMKDIKKAGGTSAMPQDREIEALRSAGEFLAREFKCEVLCFSADDGEAYDPKGKRNAGTPGKPAIYVE
ncbi:MAG: leucine--tRNA ligase [Thermoplasmata archaeon]